MLILVTPFLFLCPQLFAKDANDQLKRAEKVANDALKDIFDRWEISNYPNFLNSACIPKHSWDFMKYKFKERIIKAAITQQPQNFSMCFTGSSVTAGHDSPFNKSFAPLIKRIMSPILQTLNVNIDLRIVALGNNPLFPYDICVRTFCGDDPDLVHWEQSYEGGWSEEYQSTLEQFIRQSMFMKSNPIVVFSHSITENWLAKDCPKPIIPWNVTSEEKSRLRASVATVATELNKHECYWNTPPEISKAYRIAGLQQWHHSHYHPSYKCQGPYHKDWGYGALPWHPSISGHQLRADHFAYFWLSAWRDSIVDILKAKSATTPHSNVAIYDDILRRTKAFITAHPIPETPVYTTDVADKIQCFTDYEPRVNRSANLRDRILSGLRENANSPGWKPIILEELLGNDWKSILPRHLKFGYIDFKNMYIAEPDSGPLSVLIEPTSDKIIYICEPTAFGGELGYDAEHFWVLNPDVFVTKNIKPPFKKFVFDSKEASKLDYFHITATGGVKGETCVQTKAGVEPGTHVLTIVPTHNETKYLMFATLLVP